MDRTGIVCNIFIGSDADKWGNVSENIPVLFSCYCGFSHLPNVKISPHSPVNSMAIAEGNLWPAVCYCFFGVIKSHLSVSKSFAVNVSPGYDGRCGWTCVLTQTVHIHRTFLVWPFEHKFGKIYIFYLSYLIALTRESSSQNSISKMEVRNKTWISTTVGFSNVVSFRREPQYITQLWGLPNSRLINWKKRRVDHEN